MVISEGANVSLQVMRLMTLALMITPSLANAKLLESKQMVTALPTPATDASADVQEDVIYEQLQKRFLIALNRG